jgi:hypothetical protein
MNEEFIFRVGADVSGFTKSISDVERELKKVQTELKTKTGTAIVETNKYIAELQGSLTNLRSVGLSKLPQAANQGAASLNALGQVARDAPFGFIAIQNNLPILFDQLGTLSSKSGGAIGALKALGSSLIGPAGVTFAIGAAISGVTALIQKYGSLTNAVNVLFSANSNAVKSQIEFNKALLEASGGTGSQVAKIKILVSTIQSETSTQQERLAAYRELKKISPDVVAGIDEQNLSTAKSIKLVGENAKAQLEFIKLQTKLTAISKVLDGIEERRFAANGKYLAARKEEINLEERLSAIDEKKKSGIALSAKERSIDAQRSIRAKELAENVAVARKEISEITIETDKWTKSLEAPLLGMSKISSEAKTLTDDLDKLRDKEKQQAKDFKKNSNDKIKQAEKERVELLRLTQERIDRQDFLNKEDNKNLDATIKERRKLEREIGIILATPGIISTTPPPIPINTQKLNENAQIASNALKSIKEEANLAAAYNLAESTFFNPITDLFENFLNTGKFAFKEFGKAVLQAINQIVAKIIATGIISLLFTILSGGFSSAAGGAAGGFKTVLGAITSSLGFTGGRKVAAPSFGGVSGGALNMAGAVNLSLRGSDLVGSINRTNATISRVG